MGAYEQMKNKIFLFCVIFLLMLTSTVFAQRTIKKEIPQITVGSFYYATVGAPVLEIAVGDQIEKIIYLGILNPTTMAFKRITYSKNDEIVFEHDIYLPAKNIDATVEKGGFVAEKVNTIGTKLSFKGYRLNILTQPDLESEVLVKVEQIPLKEGL
jgi:hypothetical protein